VVVTISSPEPTMAAASTMPGPMRRKAPESVAGGSSTSDARSSYGSSGSGSAAMGAP
jgi:hypothetical protein